MVTLYERLVALCVNKGITGGRMCSDLGISKSLMTDLKNGRKKSVNAETAQKIATYFGVSDGYLLGIEQKEKPTTDIGDGFTDEQKLIFNKLMALPQEEREKKLQAIRLILDL